MDCSVLIVDDHEMFATTLRIALRGHGIDAHQITPDSHDRILSRAATFSSGLVILDLDLGRTAEGHPLRGSDLVTGLCKGGWKVLIVSASSPMQRATAAAVASGAIGAVTKSSTFDKLLQTVVKAASGQPVMSERDRQTLLARHRGHRARERELTRRLGQLSRREREVLGLLAEGHRAAAIAERFVVSMTTVRTQIRSILAKLEVNSQLEAVALLRQFAEGQP